MLARHLLAMTLVLAGALAAAVPALAQTPVIVGPGGSINQGRDCQVVRVCRTGPDGTRRCNVGSYACRVCQFVDARCTVGAPKAVCKRALCTWN